MKIKINNMMIECRQGDITSQPDIEVIVNSANAHLAPGGGVAGAIHRKAGLQLYEECKKYAPISTGQAVITRGYNLPNKYVIHTLGPVYTREKNPAKKLALCYKNCLRLAEKNSLESIAFPAISAGIFGYPIEEAARVAIKAVLKEVPKLKKLKLICFVLYDDKSYKIFQEVLKEVIQNKS
ncbi:MAG: macro domain-containing protein [Candidatus Omnitrophica bacterium]|nr:macro domain-containing protein [Candidatus Omnitrophota bacterium]